MSKPSILISTGSFAPAVLYDHFCDLIRAAGYEIKAIHLQSVGLSSKQGRDGLPSMYDDASLIAHEVEQLADQGKDVILVGHSYGGVPASQSVKGLTKNERSAQGKPGGLVRLAYMTCLVPASGKSAQDVLADVPEAYQTLPEIDEKGWMQHSEGSFPRIAAIIAQNLPPEQGQGLVKSMAKHSSLSFADHLTYEGYKHVPVSYLLCEEDLCIPPAIQQAGIDMIEWESGNKVDVTKLKADHCCPLSNEKETVDWLVGVAEVVSSQ